MKERCSAQHLIRLLVLVVVAVLTGPQAFAARDVLMVLDNSGSMKKNDPQFLAKNAVRSFIDTLKPDTRAGIIIFDQSVKIAVPLSEVNDATKGRLSVSLNDINYRGQLTDSPAAVERAIYELKTNGRDDADKIMIFMTDGIVDTGNAAADVEKTKWLREELAVDAADNGIKIYAIAFTENADFFLIQSLAKKSNGEYFRALNATELSGVFSEVRTLLDMPTTAPAAVTALATPPQDQAAPASQPAVETPGVAPPKSDPMTVVTPLPEEELVAEPLVETDSAKFDPNNPLAGISEEDLIALREISEIEGIPVEELARELWGSREELVAEPLVETDSAEFDPNNPLAGIPEEDLIALREISEIEGIPVEELARELWGSSAEAQSGSGVVISRPNEPTMLVEEGDESALALIFSVGAILLGLVILVVWFFRSRGKAKAGATGDSPQAPLASESGVQTPPAFLHDMSGLAAEPLTNLGGKPLMVGRVAGTETQYLDYLVVNAPTVGRRHAVIKYKDNAYWAVDQGSVNGTFINDERLSGERQLKHGDRLKFHNAEFEFTQPDAADAGNTIIADSPSPDATIVADAATMSAAAGAASIAATAASAADDGELFNLTPDDPGDVTLDASVSLDANMVKDLKAAATSTGVSVDDIFDVTGEDAIPAVALTGDLGADFDSAETELNPNALPDSAPADLKSEAAADDPEANATMASEGGVVAPPSGEIDHDFDAEASAFFDDITVGPVPDDEEGPDLTEDNTGDMFSVHGAEVGEPDQQALDQQLERASALDEAQGNETASSSNAVDDFGELETMINEVPPSTAAPSDPNDITLEEFIETDSLDASKIASPGAPAGPDDPKSVSLDDFVETSMFDGGSSKTPPEKSDGETVVLERTPTIERLQNETVVLPGAPDSKKQNTKADDDDEQGSEDPTRLK